MEAGSAFRKLSLLFAIIYFLATWTVDIVTHLL
jgi:hypothetical protein